MLTLTKGAASPEGELEDAQFVDLSCWVVDYMEYFRIAWRDLERAYPFVSFHSIEEEFKKRFVGFCSILGIYVCHLRACPRTRSITCENLPSPCHRKLESADIPRRSFSAIQFLRCPRYHTCHQDESPVEMETVNATPDHRSATSDRICSTQIWRCRSGRSQVNACGPCSDFGN